MDARTAVDRLLGHRILRRRSAEVSTEAALRGARASAALEGVTLSLEDLRRGVAQSAARHLSPTPAPAAEPPAGGTGSAADATSDGRSDATSDGRSAATSDGRSAYERQAPGDAFGDPAVQGALRVSAELGTLAETWRLAPRQALARLHVLAAADAVAAGELGRPRSDGQDVADPLGLGPAPPPAEVAARLHALSELLTRPTEAPALVIAAIVHVELITLRPFGRADGIVARAAQRLTFIERGLDPKSLVAPEVGHAELAAEHRAALHGYTAGDAEGVAAWVRHCADAVTLAARDSLAVCEAILRG